MKHFLSALVLALGLVSFAVQATEPQAAEPTPEKPACACAMDENGECPKECPEKADAEKAAQPAAQENTAAEAK